MRARGKSSIEVVPSDQALPRSYGATFSGTTLLVALALPRTSPCRTVTGTGGVSLNR